MKELIWVYDGNRVSVTFKIVRIEPDQVTIEVPRSVGGDEIIAGEGDFVTLATNVIIKT
jgi:hypothetical protein